MGDSVSTEHGGQYVKQVSRLAKLKGPIRLNLELAPSIGICDVPLRSGGRKPKLACPKHFVEIIERFSRREILTFALIIPDILLILKDNSDSIGAISGKINETEALLSINSAVSSRQSALMLKEGVVEFSSKLLALNVDYVVLYIDLELLPIVSEGIGRLVKSLMGELCYLQLCSDLPRTANQTKKLVTCTREIVRISELFPINLALVNRGGGSIEDFAEVLLTLESLGFPGTPLVKPPLPFCLSSLLKSSYSASNPGICPARDICLTIDSSGNGVPCLHNRQPSLSNWDISTDSWKRYKEDFMRTANFRMLDDCKVCEIQKYCMGLCDVWQSGRS
jgi:radical SAM protein with 4Fe4S-binding SPASM domain